MSRTYRSPVYFLHIHKTAGGTFANILDQQFSPRSVCQAYQWHELLAIPPDQLNDYRAFRGHFHYCFHTLLPAKPLYLTFLRDPVERVISRYQHLQHDHAHYLYPLAKSMTLRECLRHPLTRAQLHNVQVRHIAYDFDIRALASSLLALSTKMEMEAAINAIFVDLPDDGLLEIAKQRLEAFAFVGITEHFQDLLDLLSHQMQWVSVDPFENRNVTPQRLRRADLALDVLHEIVELNQADIALYEFALKRFERQMQGLAAANPQRRSPES